MRRAVPVAFRLYALTSRLFLVFFLARYLSPGDVGLYGLIVATSAYVVYVLGMDLYTYTTREVIASDSGIWRQQIVSHASFLGCVLTVVLPLLILLFVAGLLPWSVAIWFYLIVLTEHMGLEIDRMLVAMSEQFSASLVILVRQAALPTLIVPLLIFVGDARNITLLFALWFSFNVTAIALGTTLIWRKSPVVSRLNIDWQWIRRGIVVSGPFLAGTLCLRLIFTADRQIVAALADLNLLGAYTLSMSIAGGLTSLLAVGVHQFIYPALVKAASIGDRQAFDQGIKGLWLQTWLVVGVAFSGTLILHDWIAARFGQPIYIQYSWLLPAAVGCIALYNLSLVPHYALYAIHADRVILAATVGSLVLFGCTIFGMISLGAPVVQSVLWGVFSASCVLLVSKYLAYRSLRGRHFATGSTAQDFSAVERPALGVAPNRDQES